MAGVLLSIAGPDGNGDTEPHDEIIVIGRRVLRDAYVLRGSIGSNSFSYHFGPQSFDNPSDWINAIFDRMLEILEQETPFRINLYQNVPAYGGLAGLQVNRFEVLPLSIRIGIVETFCQCSIPEPG